MKYDREHKLKADLKEVIDEWVGYLGLGVSRGDKKRLADQIFYFLLHAGELVENKPVEYDGFRWFAEIAGLTNQEAEEKVKKAIEVVRLYGEAGKTILFTPKVMRMKVDPDSPFSGTVL